MDPIWNAEYSVTETLAQSLIQGQFPALAPVTISFIDEGWDNRVFQVNRSFVFRFPRRKAGVDCLLAERRTIPSLVSSLPLPISAPIYIGQPTDAFPYPFCGYPYLPGRPAYTQQLDDGQRNASAPLLAEFLRALHTFPVEQAKQTGIAGDTIGRMDLAKRLPKLEEHLHELRSKGLLPDIQPFMPILNDLSAIQPEAGPRVVTHGDLNFRNFLLDECGVVSGVIDWGDVHLGHPAVDLAVLHSFLPPAGRRAFLAAYGAIDDATWRLARFRTLYVTAFLILYGVDIGDTVHVQAGLKSLEMILRT
ncbi:phosphotransferase [Alicyclobacillus fodiniaquatilis]|uniref:Phosphotransferase n=1 Tax=Alicyclobacillus fodiniaquatilis TaxID=1661150 RepID=A0ABW4JLA9_9BACL